MRVLHWMPHYFPDVGGVEVLARQLLPALERRGHQHAVIADHGEHRLPDVVEVDGIPVLRCHFARFTRERQLMDLLTIRKKVADFTRDFGPTIDHVHFAGIITMVYVLANSRRPMLLTLHSVMEDLPKGEDTVTHRLVAAANWVTGVSRATLDEGIAWSDGAIADRSSVIMNGLVPVGASEKAAAPWPEGAPHVVAIGRLVEEKGFDVAIDAMERLPGVRLTIVGHGMERQALEARAAHLGDRVRFTGWVPQDELPALLATAHVVLVPSRWQEPFCLVALEAALAARPVVASRAGGLPEVVRDGETGLIVPMEDPAALADATRRLLDDPAWAASLGAAGRARALREFTLDRCADAYDALYQRIGRP